MKIIEIRCQACNKLLARITKMQALIEIKCPRCKQLHRSS
ncbi:MAG: Com family DNA-binding transcriptional regulator [Gammaproteobacteria bacterium]|nr:Com family DNA-binding transcriptional regulator [Gammaproteobacteria bacterium]